MSSQTPEIPTRKDRITDTYMRFNIQSVTAKLAAAAMNAHALPVHCYQLGFIGVSEEFDVAESVPRIAVTKSGNAQGGGGDHISRA